MKTSLLLSLLLVSAPVFALDQALSSEIVAKPEAFESVPKDLRFFGPRLRVLNDYWFLRLFDDSCVDNLVGVSHPEAVEIESLGPESIDIRVNGDSASLVRDGHASYVPVYYFEGRAIHPHYRVKLKDREWITLHLQIHRSDTVKTLTASVIVTEGKGARVVPVFSSVGY